MSSRSQVRITLLLCVSGVYGDIMLTQYPSLLTVEAGESIIVICNASQNVHNRLAWYQQKAGQAPKTIIYNATARPSGVPDRFNGCGSGKDYALTITNIEDEDRGSYYCLQYDSDPCTVLQRRS